MNENASHASDICPLCGMAHVPAQLLDVLYCGSALLAFHDNKRFMLVDQQDIRASAVFEYIFTRSFQWIRA
jgi:hypothetical protein